MWTKGKKVQNPEIMTNSETYFKDGSQSSLPLPNCQHVQNLSAVWKFLCCGTLDGSVCLSGRLSAKLGIFRHFDERLKRLPSSVLPEMYSHRNVIKFRQFFYRGASGPTIFVLAPSERTLGWMILPPGNPIGPDRWHIHNSAVSRKRDTIIWAAHSSIL